LNTTAKPLGEKVTDYPPSATAVSPVPNCKARRILNQVTWQRRQKRRIKSGYKPS